MLNVKQSVMDSVARMTQGEALTSFDQISPAALGTVTVSRALKPKLPSEINVAVNRKRETEAVARERKSLKESEKTVDLLFILSFKARVQNSP